MLVFSLIQRIFPDFFPSAFSERRQQLIDTYERLANPTTVQAWTAAAGARSAGAGAQLRAGSGEGALALAAEPVAEGVDALQPASRAGGESGPTNGSRDAAAPSE